MATLAVATHDSPLAVRINVLSPWVLSARTGVPAGRVASPIFLPEKNKGTLTGAVNLPFLAAGAICAVAVRIPQQMMAAIRGLQADWMRGAMRFVYHFQTIERKLIVVAPSNPCSRRWIGPIALIADRKAAVPSQDRRRNGQPPAWCQNAGPEWRLLLSGVAGR